MKGHSKTPDGLSFGALLRECAIRFKYHDKCFLEVALRFRKHLAFSVNGGNIRNEWNIPLPALLK
jgi:hypothetical protein